MLSSPNSLATEISVMLETSNVAISVGWSGTVSGVQLAAVFQSLLVGSKFQVALPALSLTAVTMMANAVISGQKVRSRTLAFMVSEDIRGLLLSVGNFS